MNWKQYTVGGVALQDVWPLATCYGCGPANAQGLQIKSYWSKDGSEVVCSFQPRPEQNAGFPNVMYGGLAASLIDCHSIWTAIASTYRDEDRDHGAAALLPDPRATRSDVAVVPADDDAAAEQQPQHGGVGVGRL